MISFYFAKPSLFSRPVWITLLEKQLDFQPIYVEMGNQEQFSPEFRALNPFSRIPVLVDDGFRVMESQAILDYLETKYPAPKLLPSGAEALATVRMVQMVSINELVPAIGELLMQPEEKRTYAQNRANTALDLFETLLGNAPYFGGDQLSLGDIMAGSLVPVAGDLGISLENHPHLQTWIKTLMSRPAWQHTQLSDAEKARFLRSIRAMSKIWQRRRRQRAEILLEPNKTAPSSSSPGSS
ncbi:glutathione S-transferase family protein [Acaryochloris sp. IP29b_bin.137]|uniref:glutathione S-transferase family protein n=1 Tax=Acaryochloris sp. IP29b_bin.137 TaxID=2969217 RepID=UPI002609F12C|nr:glutathione S-transferase family protein [Acaryochloris sp. IP29b_bin.137]